jgi:hypothetical protein
MADESSKMKAAMELVNRVNDRPVTFPPGTLLMANYNEDKMPVPGGGVVLDECAMFEYRERGWDKGYDAETGQWRRILDKNGEPSYPEADFSHLFPVPDPPV